MKHKAIVCLVMIMKETEIKAEGKMKDMIIKEDEIGRGKCTL
jgi:hypothetical protein